MKPLLFSPGEEGSTEGNTGWEMGEVLPATLPSSTSEGDSTCESQQELSSISSLVGTKSSSSEADSSLTSIDVAELDDSHRLHHLENNCQGHDKRKVH